MSILYLAWEAIKNFLIFFFLVVGIVVVGGWIARKIKNKN